MAISVTLSLAVVWLKPSSFSQGQNTVYLACSALGLDSGFL
jgi:hypothetical protein